MFQSALYLNDAAAADAALLAAQKRCLLTVSSWVQKECDRTLESTTYTDERYTVAPTKNNNSGKRMWPRQWPITTLTAVKFFDGSDYVAQDLTAFEIINQETIVYPKLGATTQSYGAFPAYEDGIKLTYVAGYATTSWDSMDIAITDVFGVPENLEAAICTIAHLWFMEGRGSEGRRGESGRTLGDQSFQFVRWAKGLPEEVLCMLDAYRRLSF